MLSSCALVGSSAWRGRRAGGSWAMAGCFADPSARLPPLSKRYRVQQKRQSWCTCLMAGSDGDLQSYAPSLSAFASSASPSSACSPSSSPILTSPSASTALSSATFSPAAMSGATVVLPSRVAAVTTCACAESSSFAASAPSRAPAAASPPAPPASSADAGSAAVAASSPAAAPLPNRRCTPKRSDSSSRRASAAESRCVVGRSALQRAPAPLPPCTLAPFSDCARKQKRMREQPQIKWLFEAVPALTSAATHCQQSMPHLSATTLNR
jgi:hypothetical protein